MTAASLIAVGASAGGIEALRTLIPNLPSGLPGAVAIVVHRMPVEEDKRLTRVLRINARLPVSTVTDGMKIEAGHVYVCPAAVHLLAEPTHFRLDHGPSEHGYRPSIDVLFRSTAEAFGAGGAGVVLSGLLNDGTAGLASIKAHGGYALAQDPSDALYGDMPRSAIENVQVDAVGTAKALAQLIDDFATRAQELPVRQAGGPLARSQPENDGAVRFRCRISHTYLPNALFTRQEATLEAALSTALRALIESADLNSRLAARARGNGHDAAARRFDRQATAANDRADSVRSALKPLQSID